MVPRKIVLRSKPTAEAVAREFLKQQQGSTRESVDPTDPAATVDAPKLVAIEGDWPGFRGPMRDGVVRGGSFRRDWSANPPREMWRHPIGRGWSAFSVVGNYAFTQEQREENECVVAYDVESGSQLWVHQDKAILSIVEANGGPGPHATPQFDDGFLYTLGGTGLLNCLNAVTGKAVWSTNILKEGGDGKALVKPPEWGVSNSPLIVGDLVIVISGGTPTEGSVAYDKGVEAYNKKTGDPVWSAGKHPASYGSARLETIAGTPQVLIPNGNGLSSHSPESGEELWFFPLENSPKVNSSMPWLVGTDSVLFGTGYGVGSVRLDIKNNGGQWEATQRWASNRFRPKFNDFVVRDGFAFGLDDGTLCCLDVETGAVKWKSGRYGYGQLLLDQRRRRIDIGPRNTDEARTPGISEAVG
jgi:outer membrane protein assembly factor BamB